MRSPRIFGHPKTENVINWVNIFVQNLVQLDDETKWTWNKVQISDWKWTSAIDVILIGLVNYLAKLLLATWQQTNNNSIGNFRLWQVQMTVLL